MKKNYIKINHKNKMKIKKNYMKKYIYIFLEREYI